MNPGDKLGPYEIVSPLGAPLLGEHLLHFQLNRNRRGTPSSPHLLSQQVFELNSRIGLRIAVFHNNRRVERNAPFLARAA